MGYIIRFEDEQALDAQMVGQKFYTLAKAFRAGFAVPKAVAISTEAHRYYLANSRWPDGLAKDVLNAANTLEIFRGLSIRSSATREDLEKQSFAGQYRTFLQVADTEDLMHNIEACWKSVSSTAVQSYLQAKKNAVQQAQAPLMAVVIQKMVNAIAAGIAFGRNPMQPASPKIVIEAVEGLAEDMVSGRRTPYRAVVDADGVVQLTPPEQKPHSAEKIDSMLHVSSFWRDIAQLVRNLETHDGKRPLDIEWAIDADRKIWLLQSRPITSLDGRAQEIPAGLWTRKIANDLWADRLTPFMGHHMATKAPLFDMTRSLKILGIPVARPTLTVIHGYLYINCKNIKTGLANIPPKLRLPELGYLLPPSARRTDLPSPSLWKLFSIGLRSIVLVFLEPGLNPFICLWLAKRHQEKINQKIDQTAGIPTTSPQQTMSKIRSAMKILSRLQTHNQWPYFFATFSTWVLRWLAVNHLGFSHSDFLHRMSETASNVTINIERDFRNMAQEIALDSDFAGRFLKESSDQLVIDLPPNIQTQLNGFLSRYGCRSRHRTLFIERWSESPQEIIGILKALVRNQLKTAERAHGRGLPTFSSGSIPPFGSPNEKKPPSPGSSLATSAKGGSRFSRLLLQVVIQLNRQFLDLRENLRFTLDRNLYLIRRSLMTLGQQTGLDDKIMFLNEDELLDFVTGKISDREARQKAADRYNEFIQPFDVATFFNDGLAENEFQSDGELIRGIGTSPGRASGRAKIVDEPGRTDIEKGDILIAKNTDPGWTPILSILGGMVMEEGGLLNHCSIVARELGIPSIVGVHKATSRIQDNNQITIDGGLGVILIEE
jgi:pyruvate,water dikinase